MGRVAGLRVNHTAGKQYSGIRARLGIFLTAVDPVTGPSRDWGCDGGRVFRARSLTEGGYVAWVLRLVEIGAEGEGSCTDVVEISRPDGLVDIADLGLTLAEAKLVLAGVQ